MYVETNKIRYKFELFKIAEKDDLNRTLQYALKDDVHLYKAV